MRASRLTPLCMIVLLGAWMGIGCGRHVVVNRDQVEALNQKNWTVHSTPESAIGEGEATRQEDVEVRPDH